MIEVGMLSKINKDLQSIKQDVSQLREDVGAIKNYFFPPPGAVPAGIIVPYIGDSVPQNWYTLDLGERYIRTYSDNLNPGETGGESIGTLLSSTDGGHLGTSFTTNRSSTNAGSHAHSIAAGNHQHVITMDEPPFIKVRFIKALTSQQHFPIGSLLLSYDAVPVGLEEYTVGYNKYLRHGTSIVTGGSYDVSISTAGLHSHSGYAPYSGNTNGYDYVITGDHTHTVTIQDLLNKVVCRAWTKLSSSFAPFIRCIAFWESLTPPAGWRICDGNNNTPDLRDCFIYLSNSNAGTKHTFSSNALIVEIGSNTWTHTHQSSSISWAWAPAAHTSYSATHTHTAQIVPPFYVLVPIMYFGT